MLRWCSRNSAVTTAQMVWLPTSSGPVLQQPSRKKPVSGSVPHGSRWPPRTLRSVTDPALRTAAAAVAPCFARPRVRLRERPPLQRVHRVAIRARVPAVGALRTCGAYDRKVAEQHVVREVHVATGVTLRYLEQGDPAGMAIVLLHHWGESLRCFDRLTALLPRSLHVPSLDQRGHGGAERPVGGYELASFAADVEAFMDTADLAAAVLVGSSAAATSPNRWPWIALVE